MDLFEVRGDNKCKKCDHASKIYHSRAHSCFVFHTTRQILTTRLKDSKHQKKILLDKIMKTVSALRNTNGGQLLIHIDGQRSKDRYLEYFDEFISHSLGSLLQDGQLYTDAYSRSWLSDNPKYKDCHDFVILDIVKGECLTTVDFNTKVSNDIELINPSSSSIAQMLKRSSYMNTTNPIIRGLEDLHESRHVEVKAFQPDLPKHGDLMNNSEALVDYIWNHLKLRHYITAFSKVPHGGSFYIGVTENRHGSKEGYRTTTSNVVGFCVEDPENISRQLYRKASQGILVLEQDGSFHEIPHDLIASKFHSLADTSPQRFVLEVSVGYVNGIVFSDIGGPRSYCISDGVIRRMDKTEWLDRFESSYIR